MSAASFLRLFLSYVLIQMTKSSKKDIISESKKRQNLIPNFSNNRTQISSIFSLQYPGLTSQNSIFYLLSSNSYLPPTAFFILPKIFNLNSYILLLPRFLTPCILQRNRSVKDQLISSTVFICTEITLADKLEFISSIYSFQ